METKTTTTKITVNNYMKVGVDFDNKIMEDERLLVPINEYFVDLSNKHFSKMNQNFRDDLSKMMGGEF